MSPGGSTGVSWVYGALAASLLGHVVTFVAMPYGGAHAHRAPAMRIEQLELFVEVPPIEPDPAPARAASIRSVETTRPRREESTREPEPTEIPTAPERTPEPTPTPEVPPTPTVTRPRLALDPAAAARSVVTLEGPRMPRAAAAPSTDVETAEQRDARLAAGLDGVLREAATARPEGFGRRVLPEPIRRPDGTLAYPLGQVVAIVNPDGSFTFDDTTGVDFEGLGNSQREGMQARWGLEEFMMRRRGQDPHAATRRWFAEQTEEMRAGLEQAYVERQARAAARGTRGRLARLLADESRPIEARRRAIFEQWDDCAEGEIVADAVREAIVAFVGERLPEGSELAYSTAELDELNRTRTSTAEFRPYAR